MKGLSPLPLRDGIRLHDVPIRRGEKTGRLHGRQMREARIHFLGVWDTVGALGIPPDVPLLMRLGARRVRFRNTELSPAVTHAHHALAVDEKRRTFSPTLWTGAPGDGQSVFQVWFPGMHADVGGGYKEAGLSDIALGWMIDRAIECGAAFRPDMLILVLPGCRPDGRRRCRHLK